MNFTAVKLKKISPMELFFDLKSLCPYNPPFFLFFWVHDESDIMHKISFFSFFPALLHCSLLLLLLNTLAKKSLAFIYLFIYIYKYNSTVNDDDKTFSFFFLLSVSFNRKRRERSHQSINQIRKVVVVVHP